MYKMLSLTHCKKILQSFLRLLPQLFLFELAFKVLSLFLFIPAGKELIVMMLEIAGDTSLYNYHMLQILFSFPGIAAIILILCLSAFLAYFEFSFIFIALYQSYAGSSFSLKDTLKTSVYSLFSLNFRDIPGFFVYGILLLPFQNLYLVPSVMPRLEIPNFVTGELSKRWYGNFVLDLGYTLIFLLFLLLLFLLPAMILKRKSFREGCKESIFTWKKAGLKGVLLLGILMALWQLLFGRSGILSGDFSSVIEENPLKTLCLLFFSGKAQETAFTGVLVWILRCILSLGFSAFLTGILLPVPEEAAPVLFSSARLSSQSFTKIKSFLSSGIRKTQAYFCPLFREIPLLKKLWIPVVLLVLAAGLLAMYQYAQEPPAVHKPLSIGHRGSDLGVENTLEAVKGAIDSGADFAEVDIQLTKDQVPVAAHDDNLSCMAGRSENINRLTLEELQSVSLSQYGMEGQVPTLEELLQLSQGKTRLLIELKAVSGKEKEILVDQILSLIEKYDFQKDCLLMSLDYELVQLIHQKNPVLKTGYCMFGNLGKATVEDLLSLNCDFVVIEESMVSNSFLSVCRQAWLPVYVWTVDAEENIRKYLDMGVNGLISDKPYLVKDVLEDYPIQGIPTGEDYYFS